VLSSWRLFHLPKAYAVAVYILRGTTLASFPTRQHPIISFYYNLICQLFHRQNVELISYSRQGAWQCTRRGCRAQASHSAASPPANRG
jgi:hypothetical protein